MGMVFKNIEYMNGGVLKMSVYTSVPKSIGRGPPGSFTYYSRTITTLQSLTSLCHVTKHPYLEYGK
jgi:hypothetical protein